MRNNRGFTFKIVAFAAAFLLIGYGYYGFFYVPQNSGYAGPRCILENFAGSQNFSASGPCMYSLESLAIGALLVILTIIIWWKFD